jgi:hypothetical protein
VERVVGIGEQTMFYEDEGGRYSWATDFEGNRFEHGRDGTRRRASHTPGTVFP